MSTIANLSFEIIRKYVIACLIYSCILLFTSYPYSLLLIMVKMNKNQNVLLFQSCTIKVLRVDHS